MKKKNKSNIRKIVLFIALFFLYFSGAILMFRCTKQKNDNPPLTWEEILDMKYELIVGSLVASGICIISIFNYNTNDK